MALLHRIEEGVYTDQYGFDHKCYRILENVSVEKSDFRERKYFGGKIIKDYYYTDGDRRWLRTTPTDYSGIAGWTRIQNGVNIPYSSEHWIENDDPNDRMRRYGNYPIIYEDII